jgi:hypothetical protein
MLLGWIESLLHYHLNLNIIIIINDKSIIIEGQMLHRPGRGFGGGACGQHFDVNLPKYNGRVPTPARPAAGKKTAFLSTTVLHYAETDYFPKTGSRQT